MTKKLFWEDAYIREFEAIVTNVDGNKILLDQTAFNGRGGGLPGDVGWLDNTKVLDSVKQGDEIVHIVEDELKIGQKVYGKLDWEKRYKIMRMHTAAHLLIGIFANKEGLLVTGNQLGYDESRMDFNMEILDKEKILNYVEEANMISNKGGKVKIYFVKRSEAMKDKTLIKMAAAMPPDVDEWRIVDIGIDKQPDGGVHVSDLKEIGKIVVTKFENKGKNNRRLYFKLE